MKRRLFIDWMRGLAVLCMIEHHTFDAFLDPRLHGSPADRLFRFLGGVAAPGFLFLAGLAIVLMLEKTGDWRLAARRGGWIFLGAYLFRFQEWALAFGAAPATDLLRIDILNAIGIALVAVALLWRALGRFRLAGFALAALAVAFAAPLVWGAPFQWGPVLLDDYLRGHPPRALFPLFPWTAHAFIGAAVGMIWVRVRDEKRAILGLALGAGALWIGTRFVDGLPFNLYPNLSWWDVSPAYFLLRTCSNVWLLAACWALERATSARLGPLLQLGRHSLIVYWVHIELVYGRWFWRARGRMELWQGAAALACVVAAMVALAWLVEWRPRPKAALA